MQQLDEYNTFTTFKGSNPPDMHKKMHKARYVADGHLTDVPVDSVYSGVVTL